MTLTLRAFITAGRHLLLPCAGGLFRRARRAKRDRSSGGRGAGGSSRAALPIIRDLPGRIAPTRIAEVRARVSGIVMSRNFEQGSDVKAGDVLYQLDAGAVRNRAASHRGRLAKAKRGARAGNAARQARSRRWRRPRAVSQSQFDIASRLAPGRGRRRRAQGRRRARQAQSRHTRRSARRSAAASAARWSPRARWSAKATRRMSPRSSRSIRSTPTSPSRSPS